jgi:hypothetical protein
MEATFLEVIFLKNFCILEMITISKTFHYYLESDSFPLLIPLDIVYLENCYYETHLYNML